MYDPTRSRSRGLELSTWDGSGSRPITFPRSWPNEFSLGIISRVFGGRDTPYSTLAAIYKQFAMAINEPTNDPSSTEKEKEGSVGWHEPSGRKLRTDGDSNGRDVAGFLSILSIVESVESIVREVVALGAQLTMLRCVTVRMEGIHRAECGGGHCQCVSELCSHACSLSQEHHMKRNVIPRLCSERGSVVPSLPRPLALAGHQTKGLKKYFLQTRSSTVGKSFENLTELSVAKLKLPGICAEWEWETSKARDDRRRSHRSRPVLLPATSSSVTGSA